MEIIRSSYIVAIYPLLHKNKKKAPTGADPLYILIYIKDIY